jgi:hypothetical protein
MAMDHRLAGGMRRYADAEFLWLDFFRATDLHGASSLEAWIMLNK